MSADSGTGEKSTPNTDKEVMKHAAKGSNMLLYAVIAILVVVVLIVGALAATGFFNHNTSTTTTNHALSVTAFTASPGSIALGGTSYLNVTAKGGTGPYSFAYTGLPAGCTSSSTASLACSPTASGSFTVSVTVTDKNGTTASSSTGLVVAPGVAITAFLASPNPVTVNTTTNFTVAATGGSTPYTYAYSGLPSGCASSDADTLACTPNTVGTYTVTVVVTPAAGQNSSKTLTLIVNPVGKDTIAVSTFTADPASINLGQSSILSLAATGGVTPYTYVYTGLPAGCTTKNADVLTCTPTAAGVYNITGTVTDAKGFSADSWVDLAVVAPVNCNSPSDQAISGEGSTFVESLMDTWIAPANYPSEAIANGSTVNYDAAGSGAGVTALNATSVDYAASDAPLSAAQLKDTNLKGNQVLTMPDAAGAVASIYNLGGLQINVNGLWLGLVFYGNITNWNGTMLQALNPGVTLPNEPIVVVHRSDGSGTSYVFQQFLSTHYPWWSTVGTPSYSTTWLGPENLTGEEAEKGSSGVAGYVGDHEYSISYVDLNTAIATGGLSEANVQNPSGKFIHPTVNDTENAIHNITTVKGFSLPNGTNYQGWQNVSMLNSPGINDYPIATFTYMMFYENPEAAYGTSSTVMTENIAKAMWVFMNWVVSSSGGQSFSSSLYYVPLPVSVGVANTATLNMENWGGTPLYPMACDA